MNGRGIRIWMFAAAAIAMSGCTQIDDLLGNKDGPKLQGSRISVLLANDAVRADPGLSDLAILLPRPLANESWPQQGGFPNHAMHHLALGDLPRAVWSADAGSGSDKDAPILSGPVTSGGIVYTMDSDAIVAAYSANEGRLIWRVDIEPPGEDDGNWGGGLAVDDGLVFAATGFAQVVALAADTGREVWRTNVSGPMRAAPTALNGRVFAVTKDNQLFALNAKDGESLWSHTGFEETAGLIGSASPAVEGGIVVVPYSSGEIFALRVENGRQLWGENLAAIRRADAVSALADIRGRPVIDRGRVYAISHSGRMVAIDLPTGRRLWEAPLGGVNQPWVGGDFIFVLTSDATVAALTARDGRIRWLTPIGLFEDPKKRRGRINWSGPVLAGDRLIVSGSHGVALSLSPYTGEIIGEQEMPDAVSLPPAIANQTLYFLTDEARLVAYR
ncbi:MAG: outer membrane protein assembly factor BamB [Alphaproteobacteria bacterium]|jgi:outer membrane protein assembly factor BamB